MSFYIHPDIISYAQETIAKLANSYDFEGKIALHKDASLGKADCRIEWETAAWKEILPSWAKNRRLVGCQT